MRVFLLLFARDSLVPEGVAAQTFLDAALAEGRRYEQRITATLSRVVFDHVFPGLVSAVAAEAGTLADVRDASLRLLYRLLFLLYAEDRDLLPVRSEGYAAYSLRGLREEAARIADEHRVLSPRARTWWPRLAELFKTVARGDSSMGLPPYNGGLFDDTSDDLLSRMALPDAVLAPLLDAMSREQDGDTRRWINYRDLSVQHLGGIYERLLERDPAPDGAGGVVLRPNAYARKTTGSYYTPDDLVQLILRRAVGPLLAERRAAFAEAVAALAGDRRPKAVRLELLAKSDPAEAFVNLRVCDPAMGSGHFLVSLVDYLADEVLTAITEAAATVAWADPDAPYRSPLARRIELLRDRIRAEAAANRWPVREDQLDDRHIVRRIILKRVIHGVDANPMAVELAKLSLWLHSFTVGAPLSFLDHHLRVGDSLFGEFVGPVEHDLRARFGLAMSQAVVRARQSAAGMAVVEGLTDADIGEVHSSAEAFRGVEEATAELRAFLDLYHAARWMPAADFVAEAGRAALFGGAYGDPAAIAAGTPMKPPKDAAPIRRGAARIEAGAAHASAVEFVRAARELAERRRFLHWEAAFPGVWDEWERPTPTGGFDAVIGNPPWDRIKMQEVEWFAARVPAIAMAQRASDRKRMIGALRKAGDAVAAAYDEAASTAEAAAAVAAGSSPFASRAEQRAVPARDYPLLSGGDANVYALFVERAARLARAEGIVGLLVPSGIAADKGAAAFFRGISTTGRLGALLDFENRRTTLHQDPFFPDVDSRFKFCALIFGGPARKFPHADCAFFQQDAATAEAAAFALSPDDFATVNPNTGTAPVFRTPRDAEITRGIYRRLPVLVDRRGPEPRSLWPVRYATMFHMTNDSGKFRTEKELVAAGAYRVAGQRWEKGTARWLPLYEGKMVQAYDHRAASVIVNSANVNRPAQPEPATEEQHADPGWCPEPQFWIDAGECSPGAVAALIGFKDVTSPTNHRTMVAAFVPPTACGNTLPVLQYDSEAETGDALYGSFPPLLLANMNALVFDFVARQKVQGQHLNFYIVEQLPFVPPTGFARRFGPKTAEQIIREDVLHLTYTAHDMEGFARDQGYEGPPFAWGEADRLRRRARLDAVFFHLYGLDRDAADYVLGTFPIVAREERARHGGWFLSRDLILGYMAALAAGNPDAEVA